MKTKSSTGSLQTIHNGDQNSWGDCREFSLCWDTSNGSQIWRFWLWSIGWFLVGRPLNISLSHWRLESLIQYCIGLYRAVFVIPWPVDVNEHACRRLWEAAQKGGSDVRRNRETADVVTLLYVYYWKRLSLLKDWKIKPSQAAVNNSNELGAALLWCWCFGCYCYSCTCSCYGCNKHEAMFAAGRHFSHRTTIDTFALKQLTTSKYRLGDSCVDKCK